MRSEGRQAGAARLLHASRLGGEAQAPHPLRLTPHGEALPLTPHSSPLTAKHRVAVIGAGWAGLAAAVELADAGRERHRVRGGAYARRPGAAGRAQRCRARQRAAHSHRRLPRNAAADRQGQARASHRSAAHAARSARAREIPPARAAAAGSLAPGRRPAVVARPHPRAAPARSTLHDADCVRRASAWITTRPSMRCSPASSRALAARRYLWEPLCISALNTPPAEASAQVFLNVLRDSFNGSREDSELLLPRGRSRRAVPRAGRSLHHGCGRQGGHRLHSGIRGPRRSTSSRSAASRAASASPT